MIKNDEELLPGAWILWRYGLSMRLWCVLDINENYIQVNADSLGTIWVPLDLVVERVTVLGYGKFNWWRKFFPWVRPFGMYK